MRGEEARRRGGEEARRKERAYSVAQRADLLLGFVAALVGHIACVAEVGEHDGAHVAAQQHVAGLDVAVEDAVGVEQRQCRRELRCELPPRRKGGERCNGRGVGRIEREGVGQRAALVPVKRARWEEGEVNGESFTVRC